MRTPPPGRPSDPPAPLSGPLLDLAVDLALGAAALIRSYPAPRSASASRTPEVTSKSTPSDLVTEVDRAVEAWIIERIRAARPDDSILGEEGGVQDTASGHGPTGSGRTEAEVVRWIVDPIDGTVNFVHGIPRYAVSIGVEVAGRREVGCVLNPATGELFWARLGAGAWMRTVDSPAAAVRLRGPVETTLPLAVVATGFNYDVARRTRQAALLHRLMPSIADVRRFGAASLDFCSLALGQVDGYFEVGLNEWDYAAGALIATEAGCVASGLRGRTIWPGMVAMAGASMAGEFFELLERLDADLV